MNTVIYKWPIYIGDQDITLPTGSVPLAVHVQHGLPQVWTQQPTEYSTDSVYRFYTRPTGLEFEGSAKYLGTFLTDDGDYVWHVFYEEVGRIT